MRVLKNYMKLVNNKPGLFIFSSLFILASLAFVPGGDNIRGNKAAPSKEKMVEIKGASIYESLGLNELGLSQTAFLYALKGFTKLQSAGKLLNDNILSIIDFSMPSSKKRLFIIDMKAGELLFNTFVSHGKNSGKETATKFSNKRNSFKSSLGFYITGDTYNGHNGYSLRLEGEEKGINDNALSRGIVMHSAAYVDESYIDRQGYIGRSEGCPAIPEELHVDIIEKIRNGSCLFMYSPNKNYVSHSKMIKGALG